MKFLPGMARARVRRVLRAVPYRKSVLVCLFALLLPLSTLTADSIILDDGKIIQGQLVTVDGDYTIIRTDTGNVRILSSRIKGIVVLHTGVSVCLRTRLAPTKKDCSGYLHLVTSRRVIIASTDRKNRRSVRLSRLKSLEFKKRDPSQQILPLLRSGILLTLQVKQSSDSPVTRIEQIKGKVEKIEGQVLALRTATGSLRRIRERELMGGLYKPPYEYEPVSEPRISARVLDPFPDLKARREITYKADDDPWSYSFRIWHLIPGWPQFERGDNIMGWTFVGGFTVLAGAFAAELAAARSAAAAVQSDPLYFLYNTSSSTSSFDAHQRNQAAIGGVALLFYVYHIFDGIWSAGGPEGKKAAQLRNGKVDGPIRLETRSFFAGARGVNLPASNVSRPELRNEVFVRFRF